VAFRKTARRLLFLALCILVVMAVIGCLEPETTLYGNVTEYSSGAPSEAAEVSLYTYQPSVLESQPPLGTILLTTTTDAQGRYELRIPAKYEDQKLVVYCTDAPGGWEVITANTTKQTVDLVFGAPELPPVLLELQGAIQAVLDRMDADLAAAAENLTTAGINSSDTRAILNELCQRHAYVVDCATIDRNGTMLVVEPNAYREFEGSDISQQEQIIRLRQTWQPVLSQTFRAVEGFNAVDLQTPVFGPDGEMIGSVSMLIRPESFLSTLIEPEVQGLPIDAWVMQLDGLILYDPDVEEIGRNLFEDPIYQPFPQLLALGREIAANESGTGAYEFFRTGMSAPVKKAASWCSVGLHDTEWRLVVTHVVAGDSTTVKRGLSELGLLSTDDALRELTQDAELQQAIAAGDTNKILEIFQQFYEDNPGLYSIQWANASGINQFGYPEENSLTDYDYRANRTLGDEQMLAAIEAREEMIFDTVPLVEGNTGRIFLCPIYAEDEYQGLVYTIRILPRGA
jgi:hypothetical protein